MAVLEISALTQFVLTYFVLKKSLSGGWGGFLGGRVVGGPDQLARFPILTRLWANTLCPHQIAAPFLPSSRVRSQP